jgi:hypothetical protein
MASCVLVRVRAACEELLFRGFLLPRMKGAFGRGDWVGNLPEQDSRSPQLLAAITEANWSKTVGPPLGVSDPL